jgi:hypothetical protein
MKTNKQPLPPYQINVRHSAVFWKSEHNLNYISVKMREKKVLVNKYQLNKIQIKFPFGHSKI